MRRIAAVLRGDRGASLAEYVLIAGLVALVAAAAVLALGGSISNRLRNVANGFGG
ncbi:MAG: Flp family type IVb pilin [Bacillota bacterium]